MTLLVHDEVDIVRDQIAFHLAAGVDFVIATDHRSSDGTTEILEAFAREGRLRLLRERRRDGPAERVGDAHGAARGDGPRRRLGDQQRRGRVLVAARRLAARRCSRPFRRGRRRAAVVRPFAPRAGEGWFAERLTARLALTAAINDPGSAFRHVAKVAHRAHPDVVVEQGNHVVSGVDLPLLPNWFPIELFHFPLRSARQVERRQRSRWPGSLRGDLARAQSAFARGAAAPCSRGARSTTRPVRAGSRRARSSRTRASATRSWRCGAARTRLRLPAPSAGADVSRAVDGACFVEAQSVRLQRRADELRVRVAAGERRYGSARA